MASTPTLQTVADYCGVSKTTVSLALRNHPRIPEKTKFRIQEAAAKIGYKMSPLVSAHMSMIRGNKVPHYKATIAIVTDWPLQQFNDGHSMHSLYYKGVQKRSDELGFQTDVLSFEERGMTGRRLSQIIASRGISGVIVPPIVSPEGSLDLDWDKITAVAIGYSMREPHIHRVCHDNYSTMRATMRFVRKQGYKRIGLALDYQDDVRVKNLWTGAYMSRALFDEDIEEPNLFVSKEWSEKTFGDWLHKTKPEVVIGVSVLMKRWAENAGFKIPQDLSLITVGKLGGDLTGYYQNFELMGEAAVEKVVGLLHQNELGIPANPQLIQVQGQWVDGNTFKIRDPGYLPSHAMHHHELLGSG